MRSFPPDLPIDPIVTLLKDEAAAKNRELARLRTLVDEKELVVRQAQERINFFERDWLYTTCQNFRGSIARIKHLKAAGIAALKTAIKLALFSIGLATAPIRAVLRGFGVGRRIPIEKDPSQCRLKIGMTEPLPETLVVGKGNSFLVNGWVFHPERRISLLELRLLIARPEPCAGALVDPLIDYNPLTDELPASRQIEFRDKLVPVILRNIPNRGVLTDHFGDVDKNGNSFWSGYTALVQIEPITRPARAQIVVRAHLDDGTIEALPLGKLSLQPAMTLPAPGAPLPSGPDPLVAVCMTTYNPPADLFRRQIDSIRRQTYSRWVCFIRDDGSRPEALEAIRDAIAGDARFVLNQNAKNLGFYKNFEAVLADVPPEADFVALSDQDDYWHPDKLESLVKATAPGVTLVYSDMNITDAVGRIKSPTYWTTRDNNYTHFPTLLLANTVTGAASLFRRNLLDYLLPFPEKHGDAYHDHWLGCTAMALGELRYIDRPLYDYVQHVGNVVGHVAPKPGSWIGVLYRFLAFFYPPRWSRNINAFLRHGRGYYFADLLRIQHTARNVLARTAAEATLEKRAVLDKILRMADSWKGRLWLALRPYRRRDSWRRTVGVERNLLHAMCWRAHLRIKAWWGTRMTARGILRGTMARQCLNRPKRIDHIDTVAALTRITAPLSLEVRPDSPNRVNVLVSIIDFKYVFGGYITVFHLCRKLAAQGFRVRLIVTDECDYRPVTWADNFRKYPGLDNFLERIELLYCFDRKTVVPVSPGDTFLATSWWTANIANQASAALGKHKFVYLIQEYEPGFYPFGTLYSSAMESYTFPHYAIFSTEILRDYFRMSGFGVFGPHGNDRHCEAFENAITSVGRVTAQELARPRRRRLLFYCRPEPHALRNMFDTGILALRKVVQAGAFGNWDFHGIGSMTPGKIKLANEVWMDLLPRLDQEEYRKILRNYDVGLSLMNSPHPSLVPIEMAGAGMLTVTNGFMNKSAERLLAISENFIPCPPTVDGVSRALCHACAAAGDFARRAAGSEINWATDWDQAFPPAFMHRVGQFITAAMDNADVDGPKIKLAA